MNVKFTQKFLGIVFVVLLINGWLELFNEVKLTLSLVFFFGAYISLIVSELQDRLLRIEEKIKIKNIFTIKI